MRQYEAFESMLEYISSLEIIDTHEHLPPSSACLTDRSADVIQEYISQYFGQDLMSAGLSWDDYQRCLRASIPLMERWALLEPYWEAARHTGYGRQLDLTAKALYGIAKINRNSVQELNERFQAQLGEDAYRRVLKEHCRIRVGLLDSDLDCDKEYFRSVYRLDGYIMPGSYRDVQRAEKMAGFRINRFDDWLDACEAELTGALKRGAVCLKMGLAYDRPLLFERSTKAEAEVEFNEVFKSNHFPVWEEGRLLLGKRAQDYVAHHIFRLANRLGLTYQIHTGHQAGNGNRIASADPALLNNLFLEYPDVRFDIFHIGYPYQQTLASLAKMFPNVYIDMCWAHVISPAASRLALYEWLDSVPANKISAFGGDSSIIDLVLGHLLIARENVASVLSQKIAEGALDEGEARDIAHRLFLGNPTQLFALDGK